MYILFGGLEIFYNLHTFHHCLRIIPFFLNYVLFIKKIQINQFYKKYKLIDRSLLYRSLGVHGNSFNAFIQGYNQERCNNATYPKAYIFFEKLRIYLGEPKSESRLFNESNYPYGFSLKKPSKKKTTSAFRAPSVGYEFC
jgi:hypothetical protein